MAKVTLQTITNNIDDNNTIQKINDNFDAIEAALDQFISRDGTLPNHMDADLDANGNYIQNVADPVSNSHVATKGWVNLRSSMAVPIDDIMDVDTSTTPPVANDLFRFDGTNWVPYADSNYEPADATILKDADIGVTVLPYFPIKHVPGAQFGDGNLGSSIGTDPMYGYIKVPYSGTIVRADLIASTDTDCTVEVWKGAGPGLPTVSDKISASDPLVVVSASYHQNTTLTGWTTTVSEGDIFCFVLTKTGLTTPTFITVTLTIEETS